MGNEVYLISTTTPPKPPFNAWVAGRGGEPLLVAKNSIPLFWYMLFDRESLVPAQGLAESGEVMRYPALSRSTAGALTLARSRWPLVRTVLGTGIDGLFARWADFVEEHADTFIHCETWEWSWLFETPGAFRSHLCACLAAFDHLPRLRKGRPVVNRWWLELLGQCGTVGRDDHIRPLGDFSYCGVTYGGRKMSWSRELYDG